MAASVEERISTVRWTGILRMVSNMNVSSLKANLQLNLPLAQMVLLTLFPSLQVNLALVQKIH
jgi:hypothetical protein